MNITIMDFNQSNGCLEIYCFVGFVFSVACTVTTRNSLNTNGFTDGIFLSVF
jgi:hypothetical protein